MDNNGGIFDEAAMASQSAPAPTQGVAQPGPAGAVAAPGAPNDFGAESEDATPEEQAELERVVGAAAKLVYGEDKSSDAVADSIVKGDKNGSATQTVLMVFTEVDKQLNMDDVVMPQALMEIAGMVMDAAENKHPDIQFSEQDQETVLTAAWEGVVYMMGGDAPIEPDYAEITQGMSESDIAGMQAMYGQRLEGAKAARETEMSGVQQPAGAQQMGGQPNG